MKKDCKCSIIEYIGGKSRILDVAEADCVEEKLKQLWPRIKEFFGKFSKKTKRLIAIALGTMLIAIIALVAVMSTRPYTTLFTGLTGEDMTSILTYLNDSGIKNYRVENNDTILVPENQEPTLKAQLLMQGYPSSDLGYQMYLGNITSLSTESDRLMLYLFDLQDRLASVIRCFDGIQNASVNIATGVNNDYVLNRNASIEASASVFVELESTKKSLDNKTADSIRRLVANAVQGLVVENVTIEDNHGNSYNGDGNLDFADSARLKMALEEQVSNKIRTEVLTALRDSYGEENLSIAVNATVDVSKVYEEDINYSVPENAVEGNDGLRGIIGTRVYSYNIGREEDQTVGGAVGTETNSDISTYVEEGYQPDGQERNLSASGEDTYDNNKQTIQRESAGGTVTNVMVTVAINAQPESVPIDATIAAIARAAGITVEQQNEKVALLVRPWPTEQVEPVEPIVNEYAWVLYAAIAGAILFLLILLIVILLIRRHRKKKRLAQEAEEAAALAAMQVQVPEVNADIMDIHTERSMELRKDVRRFAENNPEIAALMVKNWLKEEENG